MLIVLPKGRLLKKIKILLEKVDIFFDDSSRKLVMDTSRKDIKVAILRSWDIPKFVNKGIADIGFVGKDVLNETTEEENYYEILDMGFGKCRLSLASFKKNLAQISQLLLLNILCLQKHFSLRSFKMLKS